MKQAAYMHHTLAIARPESLPGPRGFHAGNRLSAALKSQLVQLRSHELLHAYNRKHHKQAGFQHRPGNARPRDGQGLHDGKLLAGRQFSQPDERSQERQHSAQHPGQGGPLEVLDVHRHVFRLGE